MHRMKDVPSASCEPTTFTLTPHQRFLRNFMSPYTPYRTLLLFHGVGVGKTCSVITIAEQFKPSVLGSSSSQKQKVLVILPSSLKDNFKRQLFDISKLDNQCTGNTYLQSIPDRALLTNDVLERRVQRILQKNYEFYGFMEFANYVEKLRQNIASVVTDKRQVERLWNEKIAALFSNRLIIIDEIHNVRMESDHSKKLVPPILERVIRHGSNNRLVMLSATPMFNDAHEIVFLMNLMLINERRPLIKDSDLFVRNTTQLSKQGAALLSKQLRGMVSYMRGENPFTFPVRLYPTINKDKHVLPKKAFPTLDIKGQPIPASLQMSEDIVLIKSTMSKAQSKLYYQNQESEDDSNSHSEDAEMDGDADADVRGSVLHRLIQISNIVYPSPKGAAAAIGKAGFMECFQVVSRPNKPLQVTYTTDVAFLAPEHVAQVAPKIARIVDYIMNSTGIVYVYSNYLYSGLIPLAIALEHRGFSKLKTPNLCQDTVAAAAGQAAAPAVYSILSRDKTLTTDLERDIEIIRGQRVKVVFGTSVSTEGIDFKGIREIHMLEPWYHMNKVEQIVGRAVRHCSHMALPPNARNVTLYHHVTMPPSSAIKEESVDFRIYRIASNKQDAIQQIETIMREQSIDCMLNHDVLYYDPAKLQLKVDMVTSQGTMVKKHALGDRGDSKYKITCAAPATYDVDSSTFGNVFIQHEMEMVTALLQSIIINNRDTLSYTFAQLLAHAKAQAATYPLDEDIFIYTLDDVVKKATPFKDATGQTVIWIFRSNKYYVQPRVTSSARMSARVRAHAAAPRKTLRFSGQAAAPAGATSAAADAADAAAVVSVDTDDALLIQGINSSVDGLQAKLHLKQTTAVRQALVDQVVDFLPEKQWMHACVLVLRRRQDAPEALVKSLPAGLALIGSDVFYNPYKDVFMKASPDGRTAEPVSPLDMKRVVEPALTKTKDKQGQGRMRGFVDISKKTKYMPAFKMVSSRSEAVGSICWQTHTIKVDMLKDYIKELDSESTAVDVLQKRDLCTLYNVLLRIHAPQTFARPFHKALAKKSERV